MYRQLTKEDRLRIYQGLNRNENLSEIGRAIGVEPEIVHAPSDIIALEDPGAVANLKGDKAWSLIFDNSKIRQAVPDFRCTIPFSIGIRHTLAWFGEDASRQVIDPRTNGITDAVIRRMEKARR